MTISVKDVVLIVGNNIENGCHGMQFTGTEFSLQWNNTRDIEIPMLLWRLEI